ncbi:Dirigent protein 21-like protein [Drosera capensis]
MATKPLMMFFLRMITISLLVTSQATSPISHTTFSRSLRPSALGLELAAPTKQKLTHLHFYFHDTVTSVHPTALLVAKPASNTTVPASSFGYVFMADDPLTVGPELSSKKVGRAQGMYASAAMETLGLLMAFNFVFTEGVYNGSYVSLFGRNAVFSGVREMPIVGGSGVFRFATGFAKAKTYSVDLETGNAVVEYNVYVLHY